MRLPTVNVLTHGLPEAHALALPSATSEMPITTTTTTTETKPDGTIGVPYIPSEPLFASVTGFRVRTASIVHAESRFLKSINRVTCWFLFDFVLTSM
eukprot:SAG31_NODE_1468_length_8223_cov_37.850320_9_plen_97_part_00